MLKQMDCLVKQSFLQHKIYYTTKNTTSFSIAKEMKAEVNFTFSFTFRKQVFIKLHTFYRRTKKKSIPFLTTSL